jgi:hypothetical protein
MAFSSIAAEFNVCMDLILSLTNKPNDCLAMQPSCIVLCQTDRTSQIIEQMRDLQLVKNRVAIWIDETQTRVGIIFTRRQKPVNKTLGIEERRELTPVFSFDSHVDSHFCTSI